jgi:hypothetical protein
MSTTQENSLVHLEQQHSLGRTFMKDGSEGDPHHPTPLSELVARSELEALQEELRKVTQFLKFSVTDRHDELTVVR